MCALHHINGGSFRLGLWRCHALGKVGQQKARPQQTVVEQIGGLGSRVAVGLRLGVDEVKRQMAVGLLAIGIQADGGVDDQRVERQHGATGTRAPLYWQLANTMSNSVREKMIFFMVVTFLFV